MKQNALSSFACNVRRELGKCEMYNYCDGKFNVDTRKPCELDTTKMSNGSIQELIELIRSRIGGLDITDEECNDIDELFDCLDMALAKIVGGLGIGLQISWPANIKAGEEYMAKILTENPEPSEKPRHLRPVK